MTKIKSELKKFIIEGWDFDQQSGLLTLNYNLDGKISFEEKLFFPVGRVRWQTIDMGALNLAFNGILIAGGISYYKTFCPAQIEINSETLSQKQADFWNKFYQRGLGEFFYRNRIDFRGLINFPSAGGVKKMALELNLKDRSLVPAGGGKDSIVSAEILKNGGEEFNLFTLKESEPIKKTAEILGVDRIIVGRELSPNLLELNSRGAYNGHVPITGLISFILAAAAILYDYRYLVMSLEKSANFGNFEYLGMEINHQYSKSEEFEKDFREYLGEFISPSIEYFSLLREWHELKIVEVFSEAKSLEKYLPVFTSCNRNFKFKKEDHSSLWCGECPKCAFVFLLLAAFLPKAKLLKIFGKNLLNEKNLSGLYRELLGLEKFKPLECVGTAEECYEAFNTVSNREEFSDDLNVKMFFDEKEKLEEKLGDSELSWQTGESGMIPGRFKKLLENY